MSQQNQVDLQAAESDSPYYSSESYSLFEIDVPIFISLDSLLSCGEGYLIVGGGLVQKQFIMLEKHCARIVTLDSECENKHCMAKHICMGYIYLNFI